ncbi:LuxR C-terminal-related transcriptional regulator [Nonomuraea sp. NPDC050556]|uniref:helix-turn-helix transcriptional regulator n=1 Tax=Nonomuraea sp. NPDC050556 TaxID=3364369 RepID=UPI0037AB1129
MDSFVGRAPELALLRTAIAERGRVVLVSGPAGIGKSRLVAEAVSGVPGVVWGRCVAEDGAPPLWPWSRVLGGLPAVPFEAADARFLLLATLTEQVLGTDLVVVLDDLHDADEASLALLRQVAAEIAGSRVLVIATHRDTPGLTSTLAALRGGLAVRSVALSPFTTEEVALCLGGTARAASVRERTGGLPLLVAAMARDGGPDAPGDLHVLVQRMLGGLPSEVRATAAAAAVLGEDLGVLAEVRELPQGRINAHLSELVQAGLLTEAYRFTHALVRESIATDPDLHRRAALALERHSGVPARIATHWERAGTDPDATIRWKRAAAAEALRLHAPEEAARLLSQIVHPPPEVLVELANAEFLAGRVRQSVTRCVEAADAAAGRPDLVAAAALVVRGAGDPWVLAQAIALCDRALAHADGVLRARLLARKASLEVDADQSAAAEDALSEAEACDDPSALLDAARARVGALGQPGDVAERLRMADLTIATARRTGQPMAAARAHLWRADAAYQQADLPSVDRELARLAELATETRLPTARWYHLRASAARSALSGRFDQAREESTEARNIATKMGDPLAEVTSDVFAGLVALVRGDPRDLPTSPAFPRIPVLEAAQALALHLNGARDEAYAKYERLRLQLRHPRPGPRWLGVLQHVTELVEAFDDEEAAEWALPLWTPWMECGGLPGGADSFCGGAAARAVGRMHAVRGHWDEAVAAFRTAAEINLRLDARPWLVHTWLDLAAALRHQGNLAEATDLADRAAAEARRLDLPGPLERAENTHPLTAREREVADLVLQALSNRQIADRLVLSERTVETHVRHILTKLGLSNRTELIARPFGGAPRGWRGR